MHGWNGIPDRSAPASPNLWPGFSARREFQEITVDQVAEQAGTISYEILTGIGKRVPRVYVNTE
ncbi:hypothetical protein HYR99_02185 [Candidatus Poribacteria bacterium]|nr:hypothetical protein [Candidatus Poribacteria bacterium]